MSTFSVDATEFEKALGWATKQLVKNSTSSYVFLNIKEDGTGSLTHRNARSYFHAPLNIKNPDSETLQAHIPANAIAALSKAMNKQDFVSIQYKQSTKSLLFSSKTMRMNVPLVDGSAHQSPKVTSLGTVNGQEFFSAMTELAGLCARDNDSGALSTVSVKLNEESLSVASTDRFVFGRTDVPFENAGKFENEFLVPYDMSSLIKATNLASDVVELVLEEKTGKLGYRFNDGTEAVFSVMNEKPLNTSSIYENAKKVDNYRIVLSKTQLKERQSLLDSLAISNAASSDAFLTIEVNNNEVHLADTKKMNDFVLDHAEVDHCDDTEISIARAVLRKISQAMPSKSFSLQFDTTNPKLRIAVAHPVDSSGNDINSTIFVASLNTKKTT